MSPALEVVLLGIVEGITEFLPISSTGHLLIAEKWLTKQSDVFNVVIQTGAMLAVLATFKERIFDLVTRWKEKESQDYILKLMVAFVITGVGGVLLKLMHFKLPEEATPIGWALLIGGVLFIAAERSLKGKTLGSEITWKIAVAIGLAQLVAAVFPGSSRSGTTILAALLLGLDRTKAIEFTFLLGVPTMFAAGGLELFSAWRHGETAGLDWGMLALGTVVSAVVAFLSVKWLLKFVQTHSFVAFGWYRIAAGASVLWCL